MKVKEDVHVCECMNKGHKLPKGGLAWEFRCGASGNAGKGTSGPCSHGAQAERLAKIRKPHLLKGSRKLTGG